MEKSGIQTNPRYFEPIVAVLKLKKIPIIWSFGVPTKTILPIRKKVAKKFAVILGFKYLNLDDQILKWLKQLQYPVNETKPSNKVVVHSTKNANAVIFQLYEFCVRLKIVPTYSKQIRLPQTKSNTSGKKEDCLTEYISYHIVEQLNRKKITDLLTLALYDNLPAEGYIIDGFPKDKTDIEHFEKIFYKAAAAIYWSYGDCNSRISTETMSSNVNKISKKNKRLSTTNNKDQDLENTEPRTPKKQKKASNKSAESSTKASSIKTKASREMSAERRKSRSTPMGGDKTIQWRSLTEYPQCTDLVIQDPLLKNGKNSLTHRLKVTLAQKLIGRPQNKNLKIFKKDWNGYFGLGATKIDSYKSNPPADKNSPAPSIVKRKGDKKPKARVIEDHSLIVYPICAKRYGCYSSEENEIIVKYYGQKAIKIIDTDLLLNELDYLLPKLIEILEKNVKILLRKYSSQCISRTKSNNSINRSFSNESINFSVNDFRYIPAYTGKPIIDRNPRLPIAKCRKIHPLIPLQLHHENTKQPTIISIQEIFDLHIEEKNSSSNISRASSPTKEKLDRGMDILNCNTQIINEACIKLTGNPSLLSIEDVSSEMFLYSSDTSIKIRSATPNTHKENKRKSIANVYSKILKFTDSIFSKTKILEDNANSEPVTLTCQKSFEEKEIQCSNSLITMDQLEDSNIKNDNSKPCENDADKNGNFGSDFPLQPDRNENFVIQNVSIEEDQSPSVQTDIKEDTQAIDSEPHMSPIYINLIGDSETDVHNVDQFSISPYKRLCCYHINQSEEYEQREINRHNWAPISYPMSTGHFKSQFNPGETKARFLSVFAFELEMNKQKKVSFHDENEYHSYSEFDTRNPNLRTFNTGHQHASPYIERLMAYCCCFCLRRKKQQY